MRRLAVLMFALVMLLGVAAPAFALDECPPPVYQDWCGKVRTQGYWKTHDMESSPAFPGFSIHGAIAGDYEQIFINQAIAFHNNWDMNSCCGGVTFRRTYVIGPCGGLISMSRVDSAVHAAMADLDSMDRDELLMLKDLLDAINNGEGILVKL